MNTYCLEFGKIYNLYLTFIKKFYLCSFGVLRCQEDAMEDDDEDDDDEAELNKLVDILKVFLLVSH